MSQSRTMPRSRVKGIILAIQLVNVACIALAAILFKDGDLALILAAVALPLFFADLLRDAVWKGWLAWSVRKLHDDCRSNLRHFDRYYGDRTLITKNMHIFCGVYGVLGKPKLSEMIAGYLMPHAKSMTHVQAHRFFDAVLSRDADEATAAIPSLVSTFEAFEASGRSADDVIRIVEAVGLENSADIIASDLPVEYAIALA